MFCCTVSQPHSSQQTNDTDLLERHYRDAEITALALGVISLLFAVLGAVLIAMGTLPETMTIGLGVIPAFIGTHLLFLTSGLGLAAIAMTIVSLYRLYAYRNAVSE